ENTDSTIDLPEEVAEPEYTNEELLQMYADSVEMQSNKTVAEVLARVEAGLHPKAALEFEKDGRARKTLIAQLEDNAEA
ncbi:hypothetical protein LCGC14_2812030, partial [marine sediment metagenome]